VPLFTFGGLGLGLVILVLVMVLRIWSYLHNWDKRRISGAWGP